MCPSCLANLALITAGVTSTGGIAALVVGQLRSRRSQAQSSAVVDRGLELQGQAAERKADAPAR